MNHFTNSAAYEMLPKTGTRMWLVYLLAGAAVMLFITLWGSRRLKKSKILDTLLLISGLLISGAAAVIYVQGAVIEKNSSEIMTEAVEELRNIIPEKSTDEFSDSIFDLPSSHDESDKENENIENAKVNKALELDSGIYIGILEIPALSLELPIASDCTLPTLKNTPGCYYGSPVSDSFVIGAHNYDSHFGRLHTLSTGASMTFTDIDGNEYQYRITDITEVSPDETEKVCKSGHSLALFTCNYSGARRIVVFCDQY